MQFFEIRRLRGREEEKCQHGTREGVVQGLEGHGSLFYDACTLPYQLAGSRLSDAASGLV